MNLGRKILKSDIKNYVHTRVSLERSHEMKSFSRENFKENQQERFSLHMRQTVQLSQRKNSIIFAQHTQMNHS